MLRKTTIIVSFLFGQVMDWIENHGEAFLSKHTGVGKSLHRARALQKRHDDFEDVAQVSRALSEFSPIRHLVHSAAACLHHHIRRPSVSVFLFSFLKCVYPIRVFSIIIIIPCLHRIRISLHNPPRISAIWVTHTHTHSFFENIPGLFVVFWLCV